MIVDFFIILIHVPVILFFVSKVVSLHNRKEHFFKANLTLTIPTKRQGKKIQLS